MKCSIAESDNYNILDEHNSKLYLTRCLTFSHANNSYFQEEMKKVFAKHKNGVFSPAPVKTFERCLVKSNTDYSDQDYPSAANICDFLRCSVTYSDSKAMINGLNMFINDIKQGKVKCIKKNGILRIKNGFNDILQWKVPQDANYCDVKLNVIFEAPESDTKKEKCLFIIVCFVIIFLWFLFFFFIFLFVF